MRPVRTAAIGLAIACAVSALPVAALAEPGDGLLPGLSARAGDDGGGDRARAALEAVDEAFDGGPPSARRTAGSAHAGRQLTLLLRDLRLGLDQLEGEQRERAERYLARPNGDPAFPDEPLYDAGVVTRNDCTVAPTEGSHVCVHWVSTTSDAPELTDGDGDGVPDQVETTRDVVNSVWTTIVDAGGYRAPRADTTSVNRGPDGKLDVYLADLGADRLYGYCATDDPAAEDLVPTVSAFCALDDDFSAAQFGGDPLESLQVTAAHEFFHAVQYSYDWLEDNWLIEGTAAWVEDELYDDVNDNWHYLTGSPLSNPEMPLDYGSTEYNPYGSWIFWRYLTERFPAEGGTGMPLLVRDVIERMGGTSPTDFGEYSTQALTRTLDVSFPELFTEFAVANRRPRTAYDEGAAYPTAPAALTLNLRNGRTKGVQGRPFHLTADTVRVVPGSQLKGKRWKLRVHVDMPRRSYGYAAAVTTTSRSGKVTTQHVRLRSDGNGTLTTVFGRKRVKNVEVTLTNASVRYRCWEGTYFACQGTPKDFERKVTATVKAYR